MDCKVTFQFSGAYIATLYVCPTELEGINSFLPIPDWAFPKALDELEKCGMIKTVRQRGKSPTLTVLCDNCYEGYPTLKTHTLTIE
jgi:hypothetical protein